MEISIIILLVIVLFSSFGILGFLFKIMSVFKAENKQLKSVIKDYSQKSENENRILRKEVAAISSKISELTEIEKME